MQTLMMVCVLKERCTRMMMSVCQAATVMSAARAATIAAAAAVEVSVMNIVKRRSRQAAIAGAVDSNTAAVDHRWHKLMVVRCAHAATRNAAWRVVYA